MEYSPALCETHFSYSSIENNISTLLLNTQSIPMTAVVHQAVGVVKDNGTLEDKPDMMIKPDIIRVDIIGIDLTENNPSVRDPGNMLTADNAIAIFLARYPRPVLQSCGVCKCAVSVQRATESRACELGTPQKCVFATTSSYWFGMCDAGSDSHSSKDALSCKLATDYGITSKSVRGSSILFWPPRPYLASLSRYRSPPQMRSNAFVALSCSTLPRVRHMICPTCAYAISNRCRTLSICSCHRPMDFFLQKCVFGHHSQHLRVALSAAQS